MNWRHALAYFASIFLTIFLTGHVECVIVFLVLLAESQVRCHDTENKCARTNVQRVFRVQQFLFYFRYRLNFTFKEHYNETALCA